LDVFQTSGGYFAFRSFQRFEPLPTAGITACGEPLLVLRSLQSTYGATL
jgi:hypothetical protein